MAVPRTPLQAAALDFSCGLRTQGSDRLSRNNCLAPAEPKLPGSSAFKAVERLGSIQCRSIGLALASVAGFASRKLAGGFLGKRRNDARLAA